jgi:hypothetical protein
MDEFDIELDSDIGTSVSKIKNKEQNINPNHNLNNEMIKYTETEFDYDKVMEILHNSETKNSHGMNEQFRREAATPSRIISQSTDKFNSCVQDVRPKREINMNKIVKNIESNIDNYNRINFNEPIPINFTKNLLTQNNDRQEQILNLETFSQVPHVETIKMKQNEELNTNYKQIIGEQQENKKELDQPSLLSKILGWRYLDIIIYVLIFMLLNNKFVIELIYDRVPYIKTIESPYPNLILRSIVFGLLIFLIKKFNL